MTGAKNMYSIKGRSGQLLGKSLPLQTYKKLISLHSCIKFRIYRHDAHVFWCDLLLFCRPVYRRKKLAAKSITTNGGVALDPTVAVNDGYFKVFISLDVMQSLSSDNKVLEKMS